MEYRFVLGIGRSGTTFLGRLMALSSSSKKFLVEPLYGLRDMPSPDLFDKAFINPENRTELDELTNIIENFCTRDSGIKKEERFRIEIDDNDAEILLVKEVHSLLALPLALKPLKCRSAVIVRDTSRVLDSYLFGHTPSQRRYLREEYIYLKKYIKQGHRGFELLDKTLGEFPSETLSLLKRPAFFVPQYLRFGIVMEIMKRFLIQWAEADSRVYLVGYEDLCRDPIGVCKNIYNFFDMDWDETTIQAIHDTTTGKNKGYYATDKNSCSMLTKPYKVLKKSRISRIKKITGIK